MAGGIPMKGKEFECFYEIKCKEKLCPLDTYSCQIAKKIKQEGINKNYENRKYRDGSF
jgi:hypothetical protein